MARTNPYNATAIMVRGKPVPIPQLGTEAEEPVEINAETLEEQAALLLEKAEQLRGAEGRRLAAATAADTVFGKRGVQPQDSGEQVPSRDERLR